MLPPPGTIRPRRRARAWVRAGRRSAGPGAAERVGRVRGAGGPPAGVGAGEPPGDPPAPAEGGGDSAGPLPAPAGGTGAFKGEREGGGARPALRGAAAGGPGGLGCLGSLPAPRGVPTHNVGGRSGRRAPFPLGKLRHAAHPSTAPTAGGPGCSWARGVGGTPGPALNYKSASAAQPLSGPLCRAGRGPQGGRVGGKAARATPPTS